MSNTTYEEQYKRCPVCEGIGLIKKIPFVCLECTKANLINCMYCENVDKSPIGECPRCRGSGRDKYNKNSE